MGVEPRWKGLSTAIPVVMVSSRAYGILVGETYAGATLSFKENLAVNASSWEALEKYHNGEGWPRSESYIIKRYEDLLVENAAWPDRLVTIEQAYKKIEGTAGSPADPAGLKSEL